MNVNVPLASLELEAGLGMVIQKPFISTSHPNSRTMGRGRPTTGLSGAHRGRWGGPQHQVCVHVKGQCQEMGGWQGPQMQPLADSGASGRFCFILHANPETATTVRSGPGMPEESSSYMSGRLLLCCLGH